MLEQTQALRQLLSAKYICKSERIIPRREDGKEFWMKVCENLASDTAANTFFHRCCSTSMLAWLSESLHATTFTVATYKGFHATSIAAAPISSSANRKRHIAPDAVLIWINRNKISFCGCWILRLQLADLYSKWTR